MIKYKLKFTMMWRYIVLLMLALPAVVQAQECKDPVYIRGWQEARHCEGELAEFKVFAENVVSYQWQFKAPNSTQWGTLTGPTATTSVLSFIANRGGNNYEYRCRMTGNCGTVIYNTLQFFAFVYLPDPGTTPVISSPTLPITHTAAEGTSTQLNVSATQVWGYQWQYSPTATGNWVNVDGGESNSLLLEASLDRNGYRYRCVLEGCTSKIAPVITLAVTPNPVATEYNHVKQTVLLRAVDENTDVVHLTVEDRAVKTTYIDGLGNVVQSVNWQGSPLKRDVIQPVMYDKHGREVRKYLPFAGTQTSGSYLSNYDVIDRLSGDYIGTAQAFYAGGSANGVAVDEKPWAETVLESSPLNRVMKQGAPGADWQPAASGDDHTVRFNYTSNAASEVLLWEVVGDECQLSVQRYYPENRLYLTETRDENWKTGDGNNGVVKEYKDKQGQVVLKRVYRDNQEHDTYYVYDALQNLRFVLPPEASERAKLLLTN
jgi:hypothetical protein